MVAHTRLRAAGRRTCSGFNDGCLGARRRLDHRLQAERRLRTERRLRATGQSGAPAAARPALPAGTVGVPVRLAEPAALALVRAGDRVDLLSIDGGGAPATPVADSATVLAVSGIDDPTAGGLLLALRPAEARRVVGGTGHASFAVLIRPETR